MVKVSVDRWLLRNKFLTLNFKHFDVSVDRSDILDFFNCYVFWFWLGKCFGIVKLLGGGSDPTQQDLALLFDVDARPL